MKFRYPAAAAGHIEADLREIAESETRLSADVIVSGGRDLLALRRYAGIPLCPPGVPRVESPPGRRV